MPYCTIDGDGLLVRRPPRVYSARFLDLLAQYSLVAAVLEKFYAEKITGSRSRQAREVTERLLLEMNSFSTQHHANLVVVLLETDKETAVHYVDFLDRNEVDNVNCALQLDPKLRINRSGHPNAEANRIWAACIEQHLRQLPRNGLAPTDSMAFDGK